MVQEVQVASVSRTDEIWELSLNPAYTESEQDLVIILRQL